MTLLSIAQECAGDLFTNGHGNKAARLVLVDEAGRDLGGWCRGAVADRIEAALCRAVIDAESRITAAVLAERERAAKIVKTANQMRGVEGVADDNNLDWNLGLIAEAIRLGAEW